MSDHDALDERLRAVERALTDADAEDLTDLRDAAATARELETLSERLDDAEERLDELDAATQALRGYVGNVRAVNRSVEQTANAALAKAEEGASAGRESESRTVTPGERVSPSENANPSERTNPSVRSCECAPCGCAARQSEEPSIANPTGQHERPRTGTPAQRRKESRECDPTGTPADQPEERGLLGRVASALASGLPDTQTGSR